jgi:hypothetical protein
VINVRQIVNVQLVVSLLLFRIRVRHFRVQIQHVAEKMELVSLEVLDQVVCYVSVIHHILNLVIIVSPVHHGNHGLGYLSVWSVLLYVVYYINIQTKQTLLTL